MPPVDERPEGSPSADAPRLLANRLAIDPDAWIAPGAVIVGAVTVGPAASIWFGCVLRADLEPITVGEATNIQDLTVVHVDVDLPVRIGSRVTIGRIRERSTSPSTTCPPSRGANSDWNTPAP